MKDFIYIGKCLAPHGIKGGFRFLLENSDDSVLKKKFTIYLGKEGSEEKTEHKIKSITFGHRVIVYLDNISDRNEVEAMLPFTIFIDRKDFPEDEEDEVYLSDLMGMEVFDVSTDILVGKVEKTYFNGAQDILVYRTIDNVKKELPLIDQFFPEIDMENEKIYICEPDYV